MPTNPAARLAVAALALAALAPAAAHAGARPLAAHADLERTGCTQTVTGNVVRVGGCTADAPAGGTVPGRLRLAYSATVDIAKGSGTQQGTLTLVSASGKDVLVARFAGTASATTGISRGTWTATRRKGAFAKLPARGSFTSRTPDRGMHVSFDVRG